MTAHAWRIRSLSGALTTTYVRPFVCRWVLCREMRKRLAEPFSPPEHLMELYKEGVKLLGRGTLEEPR